MKRTLLFFTTLLIALNLQAHRVRVDGVLYWLDQGEYTARTENELSGNTYTGDIVIPSTITYEGVEYTVTEIGSYTFAESTITSLTLPNTIKKINAYAFENCTTLEELVVPNSVINCFHAFDKFIGLKHLTLSYILDNIDLSECSNLETLRVNAAVPSKNFQFSKNASQQLKVYVPEGTKDVYQHATSWGYQIIGWQDLNDDNFIEDPEMEAWYRLKFNVNKGGHVLCNGTIVPDTIIGNYVETTLGIKKGEGIEMTFVPDEGFVKWNYSIRPEMDAKKAVSPNSNEPYILEVVDDNLEIYALFIAEDQYYETATIGDFNYKLFTYNHTAEVTTSTLKEELARIYEGYKMPQISIPEKVNYNGEDYPVTTIGIMAFADSKTDKIIIPATVTDIERCAFWRVSATKLEIPSTVKRIGEYCFTHCAIDSLLFPESMDDLVMPTRPFMYTDMGTLVAPLATVKYIRLPQGLTEISEKMFMNVDLSRGIEIPESVTSIGVSAFEQSNLREIHLPEGLTSIGSRAFAACWSLKTVTIPASVKTITSCLFADTQLDTLYIMSPTPPEAEEPLFVDINSDQNPWAKQPVLVVPKGSKQLYQEAPVWSHFDKIIEYGPATGVCSLSKNPAAPEAYYSLDGRRLTHPQKGINIIRLSDGTTRKVYE